MFLCLAALYESWSIPFSVMLVVPLGVLPLAVSSGAGAASRNAIGIGVSGGLLASTFVVIFFVPVFFVLVMGRLQRNRRAAAENAPGVAALNG